MVLCLLQLQGGGIVGGCKASVWLKWLWVNGPSSGLSAVAIRRNCMDSFYRRYERGECKSLYGE